MRIATWNLNRPRNGSQARNQRALAELRRVDADIFILTETNSVVDLADGYAFFQTRPLTEPSDEGLKYGKGENRVTIWTKYPLLTHLATYSPRSAVCARIDTPFGVLNVYGTVIGHRGNRHESFKTDLESQINDWSTRYGMENLCISGDYNLSFGDKYYFTKSGREQIMGTFEKLNIKLLTEFHENIDHIAISKAFMDSVDVTKAEMWNTSKDKTLSDHIGVALTFAKRTESIRRVYPTREQPLWVGN